MQKVFSIFINTSSTKLSQVSRLWFGVGFFVRLWAGIFSLMIYKILYSSL